MHMQELKEEEKNVSRDSNTTKRYESTGSRSSDSEWKRNKFEGERRQQENKTIKHVTEHENV